MHDTLIIPTESAPSLREIKRALLTFDRVQLVDPADRDIIPPNAWMSAIIGLPLFGMSAGPVRPLGKVARYDEDFQQLIDEISPAIEQGLVEVVSTYDQAETNSFTIGAVLMGGYPLNPQFVMSVYRSIASSQELLSAVLDQGADHALQNPNNFETLAIPGVGDGAINDIPALPLLETDGDIDDYANARTCVARARLAAIVKYTGYCEAKSLVPTCSVDGYSRIISSLLRNTRALIANDSMDPFWLRRNKVLDLSFENLLVPDLLDKISVDQVITMRTSEWGRFEKSRENLFGGAFELANAAAREPDFEKFVTERLVEIRRLAGQIESQRKSIGFRIKCDLGSGALGAGLSLLTLQAPLNSFAAVLALGGVWALQRTQTYGDELMKLKEQEREAKRGAGFAMSRFFDHVNERK